MRRLLSFALCAAPLALLAGLHANPKSIAVTPAKAETAELKLPPVPKDGTMGFVVYKFVPAVVQEAAACPQGLTPKLRESYLLSLPPEERARLSDKKNAAELDRKWRDSGYNADGSNLCSQPDAFDKQPLLRTVQSKQAIGLKLDGGEGGRATALTCAHEQFISPGGETGVDNQAYRALGCTQEWRGVDGKAGDIVRGMTQFMASGEWTQVILLRNVHSLVRDDDVEVIYANTADRPQVDNTGKFLPNMSFSVNDTAPRYRNVLHGHIRNGVLTTDPADVLLTQTWGQGGARDIRGNRTTWTLRRARLRLTIAADGSLRGVVGGYQPVFELLTSPALGGAGAFENAGIDCAAELKTLRALADGIKDPKTGQCSGVSTALELDAVPAFVNDLPARTRTASR